MSFAPIFCALFYLYYYCAFDLELRNSTQREVSIIRSATTNETTITPYGTCLIQESVESKNQ